MREGRLRGTIILSPEAEPGIQKLTFGAERGSRLQRGEDTYSRRKRCGGALLSGWWR
jgi:hypothetical protein